MSTIKPFSRPAGQPALSWSAIGGSVKPNKGVAQSEPAKATGLSAGLSSEVSRLVGDEDTMEIHTREAMQLFVGKDKNQTQSYMVPGARHAAGAMRNLFVLTAMDNPYADWMLVQVDEQAHKIKQLIATTRAKRISQLDTLQNMGLTYSIVRAQKPQVVSLGYHSPYGYMMSTLIVMFDECVRVLKSAERRDLMTRTELHVDLYSIKHRMRSMFNSILTAQRVLVTEGMRGMKRSDFAADVSNPLAQARIESARQVLGLVPEDVFAGKTLPRHSMRRERLSASDLKALEALAVEVVSAMTKNSATVAAVSAAGGMTGAVGQFEGGSKQVGESDSASSDDEAGLVD